MTEETTTTPADQGGDSAPAQPGGNVEIDIRAACLAADADMSGGATPPAESTPKPATETPGAPSETGTAGNASGKPSAPEPKPAQPKPAATNVNAPAESEYKRKQAEAQRRERSWQQLEKEKQEFRQQKAQYEAEQARARAEREQAGRRDGLTAKANSYEALARQYEQAGDDRMAQVAREESRKLREEAQQAAQAPTETPAQGAPQQSPAFVAEWNKHLQEVVAQNPELRDSDNPTAKQTMALLDHQAYGRFFKSHPDGIKMAVEVARLIEGAGKSQALEKELTSARAEIERLNKLTNIRGGPAAPTAAPSPEGGLPGNLSGAALESWVRSAAYKADQGG